MKKRYEYKDLNELEQNVLKAKNNDYIAKEYIIYFFMPYIKKISNRYFIRNYDKEDITNFLIIALLEAVNKYKYENNFFWYAINTMRNRIYNEIRNKKKEESFINIDNLILYSNEDKLDNNLINEEKIRVLKKSLLALDEDELKLIYDLYYLGKTLKELSLSNDINYYTLATKKRRVINKLKKIYLNIYYGID
ncbi:TPA: sigma-70 family RNA polymerase sigma factor [Clostridium perfringens]|uniref:Putative RNA polymerase sigma factor n=1 Tax=Clostridium perfringens TaxID=1502 RepID=A0A4Y5T402_CLOPF|nr:putative RNA polymerase sigma factor [Clostridium perfringens]HAT4350068.1 sigma-70 family RNA polymerase sigma factor [Clostridium perfringens]